MKLAQDDSKVFSSLEDVINPQYQDIVWIVDRSYMYFNNGIWKEDQTIKYHNFLSVVPDNYDFQANNKTDVSTVENWETYGEHLTDYLFVLPEIVKILIVLANPNYPTIDFTGWGNLTQSQKEVFCRTVVYVPYSLRMTVFTDEQDIEHSISLLVKSYGIDREYFSGNLKGRKGVVERMRQHVFLNWVRKGLMPLEGSKQFGEDSIDLLNNFREFSSTKFIKWLTNAVGSAFENDGFMQKDYLESQEDMETLRDELIAIYNGT